ncbi:MAG TPA: PQQ-dependent sugar dehydrogenase [Acidimicrobiia bacterium]|nr:PQQ-dependent sugar dehydrogenase [Acidimicrobiia bacterium]
MSAAIVGAALVGTACSGNAAEPTTTDGPPPTTVPTTLAATTSTAAPVATTTTRVAETTTSAPPTTTTTTTLPPDPLQGLGLERVASGLFQPTAVVVPPGDDRFFVVERRGRVRIVDENGLVEEPFLDVESSVSWAQGIEIGMLGLAFHPNYEVNGRFFVYYSGTDDARRLSEFSVSDDPSVADPSSEKVLLTRPQPTEIIRHYAGHLEFGPDGMLYVALGDGAAPELNGQDPGTVFGAILRLDVDQGETYAIPADNPFVDGGGAGEVWAFGLRNPWRFSIDPATETMHIGDVGQDRWEEINRVSLSQGGANFGWPDTEGGGCFLLSGCDLDDYELPWLVYDHDEGCSITGGRVYRGSAIPELAGHYLYADWCETWIRSTDETGEQTDWSADLREAGQVQSFGTDADGELYIVNFAGEIWKIVPRR